MRLTVEAYVAFSALCQAFHVFKPAAPPPLSNLVATSHSPQTGGLKLQKICFRFAPENDSGEAF